MDKIHDMDERLIRIEEKLDKLIYLIEQQEKTSEKMSQHIDFIDGVYDSVKNPLSTICNTISQFSIIKSNEPTQKMLELPNKNKKDV